MLRGVWFHRSLLAVDTHVARVSGRLGWTSSTSPVRVEEDVVALAEADAEAGKADLTMLSLRLILHGRRVCRARSPLCAECGLAPLCPSAETA